MEARDNDKGMERFRAGDSSTLRVHPRRDDLVYRPYPNHPGRTYPVGSHGGVARMVGRWNSESDVSEVSVIPSTAGLGTFDFQPTCVQADKIEWRKHCRNDDR